MVKLITSKNIDGITDLVVVAPIKKGFISAYENVTYATRLKLVAEGLNRARVALREYETITPFSDVTERILTLLDFRVGLLDKDLFGIKLPTKGEPQAAGLESQRFLYLTATFDGAWEPYMRLIWDPLGPFLDLLFCNCEGYVTAGDHSFEEYAQWVRDNQVDSSIFYSTSALTIKDHLYLARLEQVQRNFGDKPTTDVALAQMTFPNPELTADNERLDALKNVAAGSLQKYAKIHEMAFEALTVFYRLADYYPPEWLIKSSKLHEGRYLARVAHSLLAGWEQLIPKSNSPLRPSWDQIVVPKYKPLLNWFDTGKDYIDTIKRDSIAEKPKDPDFDRSEVQGGILAPQGTKAAPIRRGALLCLSVIDADIARNFLQSLSFDFAQRPVGQAAGQGADTYYNVGFTATGLRRIGLATDVIDHFPMEFREGMDTRSGLLGDMRENHPRNWTLPTRNWPPLPNQPDAFAKARPPVALSEIDIVVQLKTIKSEANELEGLIETFAHGAENSGLSLVSIERLETNFVGQNAEFQDYFGFRDGISQPKPQPTFSAPSARARDDVALGEILLGYRNDKDDFASSGFSSFDPWRAKNRDEALALQKNGTFLVIRKLEQHVETFNEFISKTTAKINADHPSLNPPMTEERLKAKILGRWSDGTPLVPTQNGSLNDFDFTSDQKGQQCPFASHVRRTNPRDSFQGRKSPRILRRGMLFDNMTAGKPSKGLMFMAYNASIAEQFETIQRWINGGNSTGIASAHSDPLLGVAPKASIDNPVARAFRFEDSGEIIRVIMPEPFVSLHWGQYLFVPSRSALSKLCGLTSRYQVMDDALENAGQAVIDRLGRIGNDEEVGKEWKRLLEDFDAKDPSEKDISPDMWSAIRWYYDGAMRIPSFSTNKKFDAKIVERPDWNKPPPADQDLILCASYKQVLRVLKDWKNFSTEEQLRRVKDNSGPIYVAQQPDDLYKNTALKGRFNYRKEAIGTNDILMKYDRTSGFRSGYSAAQKVLKLAQPAQPAPGQNYYKLELRRQFLLPALGELCKEWYGLPDGINMIEGPWQWEPPMQRDPKGPRCPGDFLSPSRNAFYPRPTPTVTDFADKQGKAVLAGCKKFVKKQRKLGPKAKTGSIGSSMFKLIQDDEVLARNIAGTLVGAIPPMDGNLRGILAEWMTEKTLWRHQSALRKALGDKPAGTNVTAAMSVLYAPISQAMCKRPAPDLLYRTAVHDTQLARKKAVRLRRGQKPIALGPLDIKERDLVVVSLVSASQRSLKYEPDKGDVSIVFGGKRTRADQTTSQKPDETVHACPAQELAMGAMMGIMAALLEAGTIQALPASLIVKISF